MDFVDIIFSGQLIVFLVLFYYKIRTLIAYADKEEEKKNTWGSILSNMSLMLIVYALGFMINMVQLDTMISVLFRFESMIFKVYVALFILSIVMMYVKIPSYIDSHMPNKRK